jgi:phospholipid/cholesterol/gamma-HCH transport system permease protein
MRLPFRSIFEEIGSGVLLFGSTVRHLPTLHRQLARTIDQCYFMGYATLPLVAVLSFFIGAVLALQVGYSSRDFAVTEFIGSLIGLAMARELAPVMTAVMVAGRVGAAVTAELASMKVYQEVDALRTMNIPPERFLVLPRLVAIIVTMPILTTVSMISGWIGGQIVCATVPWIGLSSQAYYNSLRVVMEWKDITDGLIKGEVFGFGIILICCTIGLRTSGGPREIGAAVTKAVVVCIIFILLFDYLVTNALF